MTLAVRAALAFAIAVLSVLALNGEREGADARATSKKSRETRDAGDPDDRPTNERRGSENSESRQVPVTESRESQLKQLDEYLASDKPTLRQPPPDWPETDIYDYGVQRVLFVEREILVDLFVKNGWHAENNALVISVDGYPSYLKARVQDLLAENPEMPVYLMHDATSDVGVLSERIRADFRLGDREVQDLGLKPEDAERFQGLRRASGQEHVPLDLVPYGALAAATGAAVLTGVLLADALQDQASTGVFASGAYTGYG